MPYEFHDDDPIGDFLGRLKDELLSDIDNTTGLTANSINVIMAFVAELMVNAGPIGPEVSLAVMGRGLVASAASFSTGASSPVAAGDIINAAV